METEEEKRSEMLRKHRKKKKKKNKGRKKVRPSTSGTSTASDSSGIEAPEQRPNHPCNPLQADSNDRDSPTPRCDTTPRQIPDSKKTTEEKCTGNASVARADIKAGTEPTTNMRSEGKHIPEQPKDPKTRVTVAPAGKKDPKTRTTVVPAGKDPKTRVMVAPAGMKDPKTRTTVVPAGEDPKTLTTEVTAGTTDPKTHVGQASAGRRPSQEEGEKIGSPQERLGNETVSGLGGDSSTMPRPTNEIPVYWKHTEELTTESFEDVKEAIRNHRPQVVKAHGKARPVGEDHRQEQVLRVKSVSVDTSHSTTVPQQIEALDLHSLLDLHQQLEAEVADTPGELILTGKVSGLMVGMLVDTGASVTTLSTRMWERIHELCPGWTMMPTEIRIRAVSGETVPVRGQVALEIELEGQFYVHQFIVIDVKEDIILGMDFLVKHQVDIDWRRGVLTLRGEEVRRARKYSLGDKKVRRVTTKKEIIVPAGTQCRIEARIEKKAGRTLPDWGMVTMTGKLAESHGVIVGRSLVDPRNVEIPLLIMNPGKEEVILAKNTTVAIMSPVLEVGVPLPGGTLQQTEAESPQPQAADVTMKTMNEEAAVDGEAKEEATLPMETEDLEDEEEMQNFPWSIQERFLSKQWSEESGSDLEEGPPRIKVDDLEDELVPEHLTKMYRDSAGELTKEERKLYKEFLWQNADVFATSSKDLGRTSITQHRIDTGDAAPIKQAPRRVPIHRQPIVQEELDGMLERGVIEPCESPWASPIVLAAKKDGTTRFCVDYRRLNEVTRKDAYPLPRIEDNLDALQGAEYYSTLDMLSGFWQVEMAPEDRDKTAFCPGGGGLYRFLAMPFGLCNAPATFQRLMERVLSGLQWEIAVLYIDDIIVYGNGIKDHLRRLARVLDRLRQTGLKLKPAKCDLLKRKVPFLGHIVSAEGVAVDGSKIDKVKEWPTPRNLTEVRSFVGLCAYYRRFVPDFSTITKPLFDLTKKDQEFVWGEDQQKAMETMKKLLTSAPILGYPRPDAPFVLDCDASNVGIGAVLSQVQDGEERVIAYASKTLSKAERNYCVTRRELLAIVTFVKQYHHYLYGGRFLVRTDHAALYWLLRKKDPEGQMARWIATLQGYNMILRHRPGKKHGNADAMSRCTPECHETDKLDLTVGEECTLRELQRRARVTRSLYIPVRILRKVTTRAQARKEQDRTPLQPMVYLDPAPGPEGTISEETVPDRIEVQGHTGLAEKALTPVPEKETSPVQSRKEAPRVVDREPGASSVPLSTPSSQLTKAPGSEQTLSKGEADGPPQLKQEEVTPEVQIEVNKKKEESQHDSLTNQAEERREKENEEEFFTRLKATKWSDEAIAHIQDADKPVSKVKAWKRDKVHPTWNEIAKENHVVKTWWARWEQLFLSSNGVLYLRWEQGKAPNPPTYRVVATAAMFKSILTELHDEPTAGHLGQKKTIGRVKASRFYWPGMATYALRWVANCMVCASRKHPKHSKRTPMTIYRVGTPMDRVSIDIVGPFHPRTKQGHLSILTITDQYTRWVEAYPLRDATAPKIAQHVQAFCCRLGMPLELHSDQGKNVDGRVVHEVCEILGIRKTHTSAYRPQGNAITERENAVIKAMLSAYTNKRQDDWDLFLDLVMMAFRSSVHRTLGETPNAMMLAREVRLPLDAMVLNPPEASFAEMPSTEYAINLAEAMKDAHESVQERVTQAYRYQKKEYDRKVKANTYREGQAVWLREFANTPGKSKSLRKPYSGPWIIMTVYSRATYKIQKTKLGKTLVVHSDRLKPYLGEVTQTAVLPLWKPSTVTPLGRQE